MKNDFLPLPEEASAKKGEALSGLGLFCAIATLLIFSALFFSDVSLSVHSALDFGVDFTLLFFSSYVMFFSLFETGKEKASEAEEYKLLHQKREELFARYRSEGDTESMALFCKMLSERESEERRAVMLSSLLITDAEYNALLNKEPHLHTKEERRILRAMKRVRRVHISPHQLLAERSAAAHHTPFARSPEQMRRRRFLLFLLPTALTALFSVSVICEVIDHPTADVIVGYLMKLFTLCAGGVKGFRSGFIHVKEEKSNYLAEQCFWLEEYFSELQKKKG